MAFGLLYLVTAASAIQGGDSGELVTVASLGGVAHPSGYPLFGLVSRLFVAAMPFGSPTFAVAALSSLLGAATLAVLHRAVLRATDEPLAAAVAACGLGLSPLFWRWSVVPEVLSGSTLTAALVVLVCVRISRGLRGWKAGLLLGLAFATGVAHHHTAILVAPLLVYGFVVALPRPWLGRGSALVLLAAVGGTLVGLLPYLALMPPGGGWRWGETTSFNGLVHHFMRADYGTLSTGRAASGVPLYEQPLLYLGGAWRQLAGLPALLGLAGFVVAWKARTGRGFALALLATWLLAGPVFVTRFDLPAQGYYRVVVERFHSFPNVLLVVAVGFGVAWFARLELWSRRWIPAALLVANLAVLGLLAGPRASMRQATVLEDFLHNTLGAVEPDALVLTQGDSFHWGCLQAQEVHGVRPDVACISPKMLGHRWYRERVAARHPDLVLELDGRGMPLPELVIANADLRPVYLSVRLPAVQPEVLGIIPPVWPAAGTLLRASGQDRWPPPPTEVEAALLADWQGFVLRSRIHDEAELGESLEATAWDHYALVWLSLAGGFEAAGDPTGAERCRERARELSPWLVDG